MSVQVLPYGDRALLVEVGDTADVVAYVDALRESEPPGLADVVPAARTVLVVAGTPRDVPALRQALCSLTPGRAAAHAHDAHTSSEWRVAFGGFAPGFGYLVTDHDRLHVPRRDSARTAVPAGAVGLAGEYTGVYPRESPGGWQLIGTTDAPMWDLDREPPALLRPGARVRFVDGGQG